MHFRNSNYIKIYYKMIINFINKIYKYCSNYVNDESLNVHVQEHEKLVFFVRNLNLDYKIYKIYLVIWVKI